MFKTSAITHYSRFLNIYHANCCKYVTLNKRPVQFYLINNNSRNTYSISKKNSEIKNKNEYKFISSSHKCITNSSINSNEDKYYNFDVETYGRLHIQTGNSADIFISPQDVETCPDMNKFNMQVINGRLFYYNGLYHINFICNIYYIILNIYIYIYFNIVICNILCFTY